MADFGISTLVDARQAQLTKDFLIYLVILCESQKKKQKKKWKIVPCQCQYFHPWVVPAFITIHIY